jgi:hypothetical protein
MTFNHFIIVVFPSTALISISGDPIGFLSMAEVFFFLAGCVTYLAYFDGIEVPGDIQRRRRAIVRRVGTLCAVEIVMMFGFQAAFGYSPLSGLFTNAAPVGVNQLLPLGLDILPLYIVLLTTVAAFHSFFRRASSQTILSLSVLLWIGALGGHVVSMWSATASANTILYFNIFAIQLLYFVGFVFAKVIRTRSIHPLMNWVRAPYIGGLLGLLCAILMAMRRVGSYPDFLTLRQILGPLRIVNFFALSGFFIWLSMHIPIVRFLTLFRVLGRNSLMLFALSTMCMYFLEAPVRQSELGVSPWGQAVSGVIFLFGLTAAGNLLEAFRVVKDRSTPPIHFGYRQQGKQKRAPLGNK